MNSLLSLEEQETQEEAPRTWRQRRAARLGRWVRRGSTVVVDLGGAMPGELGDAEGEGEIVEEISSRAVMHPRIAGHAQQALVRLAKTSSKSAAAILAAVRGGRLGGIYQDDQKVPAMLARSRSRGGSQLIPPGADAAVVARPAGASPILVFRSSIRQHPRRLDAALWRAWGLFNAAGKISMKGLKGPAGARTEFSLSDLLPFPIPVQSLLPRVRPLDPKEIALAAPVFGSSLRFGKIMVSDALGLQNRPFTLALPFVGTVLNMGSGPFKTPASDPSTLIHELVHSWQSQHHFDSMAYEANAIMSQAQASLLKEDAYCYVPGKRFQFYAAEQIAQSVENGFRGSGGAHAAAITAHIRASKPGAVDAANVLSLTVARSERRGGAGVVC